MTENQNPQGAENNTTGGTAPTPEGTPVPPTPGAPVPPPPPTYQQAPPQQTYSQSQVDDKVRSQGFGSFKKEKWPAVILAFFLGTLGIHKFYLGYKTEGLIMLLVSLIGSLCFGLGALIMAIISIIEAVRYISLTEVDFEATYLRSYKGWL